MPVIPEICGKPKAHYRVELTLLECPSGPASSSMRDCMCCGISICSGGGGGRYLCKDCLTKMDTGEMQMILNCYDRILYEKNTRDRMSEFKQDILNKFG